MRRAPSPWTPDVSWAIRRSRPPRRHAGCVHRGRRSIAVGVLQSFTAAGVLVPRDTSVISINNQSIAQYTSPTLTSYDIDQNELADTAITMLAEAISSKRTLRHHTFISTTLVVRDSFVPVR